MAKQKTPKSGRGRWLRRIVWTLAILVILAGAAAIGTAVGAWFWISQDLPRIERLADYRPPAVTQVLAADGSLMAEYFRERRYVIPINDLPPHVKLAFVAAEDGEFYQHQGIDLVSIVRAALANLKAGRVVQGGSTITQQVARGLLLTPKKTIVRKLKEMILAWRIERYLTKEEILYLYLNQIYLGHGAYGVQAASRTYFNKDARDLDIAEAALLAGLVQAPSRYSPLRHPRRARTRQVYVIERLLDDGHITQEQAQTALNRQVDVGLHRLPTVDAPYYTEAVRQWLEEKFGAGALYEGGLTVRTACDPKFTLWAQEAVNLGLEELNRRQGYRGPESSLDDSQLKAVASREIIEGGLELGQVLSAVVVGKDKKGRLKLRMGGSQGWLEPEDLEWAQHWAFRWSRQKSNALIPGDVIKVRLEEWDPEAKGWKARLHQAPRAQSALLCLETGTGKVRALIGGRDYEVSQFNRALQARRQPGSAFKPFIYSAALDHPQMGFTPASVIVDAPVIYDDPALPGEKWKPKNYEGRFYGATTLRTALEHSRNVVTVKLLSELGLGYTIQYAHRFGFTSELTPNLSLALGTAGLSLLELTKAYSVFANSGQLIEPVLVERVQDREGVDIYSAEPEKRQAISPQTAYIMTHLLRGVMQFGTGKRMQIDGRTLAGKTGTTNDLRDAWFLGFSPALVCGVWVGQDDNQPLGRRETGAKAAGPIWRAFMAKALEVEPPRDFPVPPEVVFARVDKDTGQAIAAGAQGGFFEAFREGTQPQPPLAATHTAGPAATEDFLQSETFAPNPHLQ